MDKDDDRARPYETEISGVKVTGYVQACRAGVRDYVVTVKIGTVDYFFMLVMTGLGASPLYVASRFEPILRIPANPITVSPRKPAPEAFAFGLEACVADYLARKEKTK